MRIMMILLCVVGVILSAVIVTSQTTTRNFELGCQPLPEKAVLNVRVQVAAAWSTDANGCTGGGATISYSWDAVPNAAFYFVNGTIVGNITRYQAVSLEGFRVGPCVAGCACQPELFQTIANSIPNPVSVIARLNDGSNLDGTCAAEAFPTEFCGNLIVDPGEDCDDGNTLDNDGCSASCRLCNFSSGPGEPERCFGAIGRGCDGFPIPFGKDPDSCLVLGFVSAGSIHHDRCCIETDNTGVNCANPDGTNKCSKAWNEATADVLCARYWGEIFGPYRGNNGDCTGRDCLNLTLRAPTGAVVDPKQQSICQSGRCRVGPDGKTIIKGKGPCKFCECE